MVYHPEQEWGNLKPARLPERYDRFLYLDQMEALHPLHVEPVEDGRPPETYP